MVNLLYKGQRKTASSHKGQTPLDYRQFPLPEQDDDARQRFVKKGLLPRFRKRNPKWGSVLGRRG
jgi:hypothetical protein